MARTTTPHTFKWLRDHGIPAGMVERRTPPRPGAPYGLSHDLFGIIDIIALSGNETWGVQSCGGSGVPDHVRKLCTEKFFESMNWLRGGNRLFIYGWRKTKFKTSKGEWSKAKRWKPREIEIVEFVPVGMDQSTPILRAIELKETSAGLKEHEVGRTE